MFRHRQTLRVLQMYLQHGPPFSQFPPEPWFLSLENGIRIQDRASRCAFATWNVIASSHRADGARKYMCGHNIFKWENTLFMGAEVAGNLQMNYSAWIIFSFLICFHIKLCKYIRFTLFPSTSILNIFILQIFSQCFFHNCFLGELNLDAAQL